MLHALRKTYGDDAVMLDCIDDPAEPLAKYLIDPIRWCNDKPTELPDGIRVVHGHYRPEKYDQIRNAFRFTFLRHPIENIISIYAFWKTFETPTSGLHAYFLKNNLDIVSLAKLPLLRYLYSQTYFGDWDLSKLDYIGFIEERTQSFANLSQMLGVSLDSEIYVNKTDHKINDRAEYNSIVQSLDIRLKLESLLIDDIRLYDSLKNKLMKLKEV
jgi:hypothetical protein